MSKKPVKLKPHQPAAKSDKVIVVFGLDEDRKPRAGRFTNENEALLAKAAAAVGLRLAVPMSRQHHEFVAKLPAGRLHGTGKGFVPNVRQDHYDQLVGFVGGDLGPISAALPKSWDDVAAGHVVIAQDTVADGWWPAVVTKRHDDKLALKWRDYPGQLEFVRPTTAVALLKHD
jgi:hypothetical protein